MYAIVGTPITSWVSGEEEYLKKRHAEHVCAPIFKKVSEIGGQSVAIIPFDFSNNIGFIPNAVIYYIEEMCRLINSNIDIIVIAFPSISTNKQEEYVDEVFKLLEEKVVDMYGFCFDSSIQAEDKAFAYLKNSTIE